MNYFYNKKPIAKLWTTTNQAGTHKSPVQMKGGAISSSEGPSSFVPQSDGDLINSILSLQAGGRKPLLIRLVSALLSTMLAPVQVSFEKVQTDTITWYISL